MPVHAPGRSGSSAAGLPFEVTMDPALDADTWLDDRACAFLGPGGGAAGLVGDSEAGTVPSGAQVVIADGLVGTGSFAPTIG